MESATPPNYRPQAARYGPRCDMCESFSPKDSMCKKYSFPVKAFMACESWKRDPNLPVRAV